MTLRIMISRSVAHVNTAARMLRLHHDRHPTEARLPPEHRGKCNREIPSIKLLSSRGLRRRDAWVRPRISAWACKRIDAWVRPWIDAWVRKRIDAWAHPRMQITYEAMQLHEQIQL